MMGVAIHPKTIIKYCGDGKSRRLHMAHAWRWWWRIAFARMQVQPPVKEETLQSIAPVAKCLATDVSQGHPYASTEAGPYSTCRYLSWPRSLFLMNVCTRDLDWTIL